MRKDDIENSKLISSDAIGKAALDRWAAVMVLRNPRYLEDGGALDEQTEAFMDALGGSLMEALRVAAQSKMGELDSIPQSEMPRFLAFALGHLIVQMTEVEIRGYMAKAGATRAEAEYAILRTEVAMREKNL